MQTFRPYEKVTPASAGQRTPTASRCVQTIAVGPAASQVIIKQLGTNGGGFFNVNSAHPLENPTPLSDFVEMLAILLIPAALCYTFGQMIGDRRQGWAVLAAMLVIFVPLLLACYWAEQAGNPALAPLGVDQTASQAAGQEQPGGNMEGKEVRFGIAQSALWATATTAASNGSVNSMHDCFTPLGGLVPMWLMQLGEVVFGGVGSGLYGMIVFAIIAVFVAGLMVGRTPEYLGKKIEAFEMKMAALVILIPPLVVLVGTAAAVATAGGRAGICQPRPARPERNPLRLLLDRQQQRQRLRRAERQHAGIRHVLQLRPVAGDARGPLLAGDPHAGDCRLAGEEEEDAHQRRHPAHAYAAVRRALGRHGAPGRGLDVRAGAWRWGRSWNT